MAPLLRRLPDGRVHARTSVLPGLRVTLGVFGTAALARAAESVYRATGALPDGSVPALAFRFVQLCDDGSWEYEHDGVRTGGFASITLAAKARHDVVSRLTQIARRTRERAARGGSKKPALAPKRGRTATEAPLRAAASAADAELIDFTGHESCIPWLDISERLIHTST